MTNHCDCPFWKDLKSDPCALEDICPCAACPDAHPGCLHFLFFKLNALPEDARAACLRKMLDVARRAGEKKNEE